MKQARRPDSDELVDTCKREMRNAKDAKDFAELETMQKSLSIAKKLKVRKKCNFQERGIRQTQSLVTLFQRLKVHVQVK
jgi:hypothetical protein